jgi:hypothetical protein
MSIHIGKLSAPAFGGIARWCEAHGWSPLMTWESPERVAWLTYLLRHVPDSEDVFPSGKWATIQRLQELVDEYAKQTSGGT